MVFDEMDDKISKDSSIYTRILLGRALHSMLKARQKELAPSRISPEQAHMLFLLYNLGRKATITELAKYLNRGNNTISIQIMRMEKDGLVKKTRRVPKSTLLTFELTKHGLDTYYFSRKTKVDKEIMSVLSDTEREQIISMLKRIITKADEHC